MEEGKRSRTAERAAIHRALHQEVDGWPKIIDDPLTASLIDKSSTEYNSVYQNRLQPYARFVRTTLVLRSRYTEDCLAETVSRGVTQYMILGAGLDTFAYRQPRWADALHIFEVDHPTTQRWKRQKLVDARVPLPANLTFASVDFEGTSLRAALEACGFSFEARTFCSWLGVIMYLTEDAIDGTLRLVSSFPPGSEIVASFMVPQEELSGTEAETTAYIAARVAEFGEPLVCRITPAQLEAKLRLLGFAGVVYKSPEEMQERYFRGRTDGLAAPRAEQLMRAVV